MTHKPRSYEMTVQSEHGTQELASALGRWLRPGDGIGLEGDLGAGKTTFARAAIHALGVPPDMPVTSPTFALIHEFQGRFPVVHADLYRMALADEVRELGLRDQREGSVLLVEWAGKFISEIGGLDVVVTLSHAGATARHLRFEAYSERGASWVQSR